MQVLADVVQKFPIDPVATLRPVTSGAVAAEATATGAVATAAAVPKGEPKP